MGSRVHNQLDNRIGAASARVKTRMLLAARIRRLLPSPLIYSSHPSNSLLRRQMSSKSTIERSINLERVSPGTYRAIPDPLFANAQKSAHGGYLLAFASALLKQAARMMKASDGDSFPMSPWLAVKAGQDHLADSKPFLSHPLSLHASYLNPLPLDPSTPWTIVVKTLKQGRRYAFLDIAINSGAGKPGIQTSALFSAEPPRDDAPTPLVSEMPKLPPPKDCVNALDIGREKGLSTVSRPHTTNLVSRSIDVHEPGYVSWVGWTGTPFGSYAGAAYWVDGLPPFGMRASIERRSGKTKPGAFPMWSTLTMTVDFTAAFVPRSAGDPFALADGSELYIADERLIWLSGSAENGHVAEEVDLWDPSTGRLVCRTKQVGLIGWADLDSKPKM